MPTPDTSSRKTSVDKARDALRETLRAQFIDRLPDLIQEWEDAVRMSASPKDFKELITPMLEVLEMKPKADQAGSMPVLQINILRPDGTPIGASEAVVIDAEAVEVVPALESTPSDATDDEATLAQLPAPESEPEVRPTLDMGLAELIDSAPDLPTED